MPSAAPVRALDPLPRADRAGGDHGLRPRARAARGLRGALALVGRRHRAVLGADLVPLRRQRRLRGGPRRPLDAGSALVPRGGGSTTPATSSAIAIPTPSRSATPRSCASSTTCTWGELAAQTARIRAGLVALGVGRGDRVAAYLPNILETIPAFFAVASLGAIWSSAAPEFGARSVIDRFAQIEPKVLLAVDGYRYGGRDFDRGAIVAAIAAEIPGLERTIRFGYLDGSGWEDGLPRLRGLRQLEFDAASLRPPALGPLLVGHDRPAEADRPRSRRDAARAPQEDEPPRRRPARRPRLLVHDDRLDDVELPRRGSAHRRRDRPLRRQPRPSRPRQALAARRRGRDHDLRHERELHRELHEGGRRARRRARPLPARGGRLDRLPALPRGLRLGLRAARRRHLAVLDLGRHRRLHRLRRRRPDPPRLRGRAAGAGARRRPPRLRARRRGPRRRGRRARHHPADAVDADLLLGRRGRQPAPRELLRHLSRRLAPRRLDRDHRSRHGDHLRPLRLDDQPRRRAHGHERDLPRGALARRDRSTRSSSTSPATARRTGCRCSSSSPTASSSTTS